MNVDTKRVKITVKSDDIYYIIADAEFTHYTAYSPPKIVGTPGKSWRTPVPPPSKSKTILPPVVMDGRGWHKAAFEYGAKLRPDMQRGKVYLYQLYTTCFVEFDTLEQATAFRRHADKSIEFWDYDPVATIDTNDPETVQRWEKFMEDVSQ